ncbi:hypothetical protein [Sphingobium yanoikuyae]|uniref:Tip attachment protein J domain-containing protein n=1 Tax=Sphingobium yanoikuyae TaxID=13690 RepID=A0A2D1R6C2_SPHYA|nr:hypothetical protein [Sphingobium yanoikuyae]ATP20407.1 hypothetical protein BV87_19840 [Sphingobium yanoikuyae]
MSGFMRKAALVVGAVALVAATAGAAAPLLAPGMAGAAGIASVSAATLTAIGTYGGLAAGVLTAISTATAPGMSSQGSQTSFTTNPQSGLPYAMGRTRMSGLRIYANTNTRPGYTKFNDLLWFGALLSVGGAIGGIEKFTADNEVVTFDASGNAIGDYHDYQAQKIHLGGQQTSALALTLGGGSAPGWSSAHKLSGITHAMWCLRYNKQGEMYGAGAPEPAWIGNWVKVYDPRLDSTYPGGSGSCRALVESTYVWSDNPGLHALTWALGRWQNGKRTCGIGAPVANIRVAEFVECANVCEANGWKVGGVEWTTDSKWDTLKRILQAGGAIPTQTGAMVGCLVSTPRTAIATIESRHLLDSLSIAATKSRRDRFNSVIPRYVDEDSDWSVISGTAITVSDYVTADKGQRTKEIDYPLVQVFSGDDATQPGQLAAYDIVNSREAGPINFTTGPEWIGLKTGDVILLNVPEEGLVNQPILITRRAPDPSTGKVAFSAQTETYAKHAYALGQSTTPPAPFSLTAPDLKPPAPAAANWAAAGTVTGEGLPAIIVTGNSEMPSADAVLIDYKLPADATWTRSAILSANEPVQHVIAPLQSETAYQIRVGYRVEQIDGEFTILAAVTTGVGVISDISNTVGEQQDKLAELEADTAAANAAIAQAQQDIQDLFETYGDSASAAASAAAAANSASAAQGYASTASSASANAGAARDQAQAAQAAASASATAAANAKTDAEAAFANSVTARNAAQAAQTAAETARAQAVTAKTDAETAFANSSTAKDAALAAQTAAQLARDQAQTSATNASGSATAAAGHASTASTKATEAGESATAAAAQALYASSHAAGNLIRKGIFSDGLTGLWQGLVSTITTTITPPDNATRVLRSTNRDSGEGGFLPWNFATARKLRLKGYLLSFGSFPGKLGVSTINAAGTLAWLFASPVPAGASSWSTVDQVVTIPADVTGVRGFIQSDGTAGAAGHDVRATSISIVDVTESDAAAGSATAAATSASAAATSAGAAGTSATAAQNSATAANTSAGNASTSASQASTSATNAAGSASAAQTSATNAANSATAAGNSAGAASTSASTASTKATEASQSASAAQTSATTASTKAGEASTSASHAASSATTAQGHAATASTQASNAANSATAAGNSATAASGSASTASTAATNAGNSASAAAASAVSASSSYDGARLAAVSQMPSDFINDGEFWSASFSAGAGLPAKITENATYSFPTIGGIGKVAQIVVGSSEVRIAQIGLMNLIAGRRYRITASARQIAGTAGGVMKLLRIGWQSGTTTVGNSATNQPATALNTWYPIEQAFNADTMIAAGAVGVRAIMTFADAGTYQIQFIRLEDITESTAAATSSAAAATSASAAGQSATAAQNSATAANTSAGNASTSAGQASTSATNAAGSASAAQTSATNAANSATSAGNSASAASASASTASTKATEAGQSASASAASAVSASSSYSGAVAAALALAPEKYGSGNEEFFSTATTGAPMAMASALSNGTASDGTPIYQSARTSGTSDFALRAVVPAVDGRIYEIEYEVEIVSSSGGYIECSLRSLDGNYASLGTDGQLISGSGIIVYKRLYSRPTAPSGGNVWRSGAVWLRPYVRTNASAGAITSQIRRIKISDVTARESASSSASAAATSASSAGTSATNAGASATSASNSANTASTQATNAANSATAASNSASTAQTAATNAGIYATAAQQASVSATLSAAATLPIDFTNDGEFWCNNYTQLPPNTTPVAANAQYSFVNVAGVGRVLQVVGTGSNIHVATRGWVKAVAGRLYRVTTLARALSGSTASYSAFAPALAATGGQTTAPASGQSSMAANTWYERSVTISGDTILASGSGTGAYLRGMARLESNVTYQIAFIRLDDVTESNAASGSASAAAASASAASASQTAAGNSASAAQTSATNAATSAGNASTFAGNASTSATNAATSASNAAGSASTASTQATNAANSATAAGNSATAAAGSASTAATQATNAGNSASAAAASAVSASSSYDAARLSAASIMPSDFVQEGRYWQSNYNTWPENATPIVASSTYSFPTVSGVGTVLQVATTEQRDVANIGMTTLAADRIYRVTASVRQTIGATGGTVTLFAIGPNTGGSSSGNAGQPQTISALNTWYTVTRTRNSNDLIAAGAAWVRSMLRFPASAASCTYQVAYIRIEDVTESASASGSASAAASSASSASTSATNAANSASAASSSATTASTQAGNASSSASSASTSAANASSSATNAANSATSASGYANTAQTKAGEASSSASAASSSASAASASASSAQTSATNASTYAGQAQSSATAASTSATVASDAASAAQTSATVSAQVAASSINPNPVFANWPTGSTYPTGYTAHTTAPTVGKPTGKQSPYALGTTISSSTATAQGLRINPVQDATVTTGVWLVLEVDAHLGSGTLAGAGVIFRALNSSGSIVNDFNVSLFSDPDIAGGTGNAAGVRRWRRLVQVTGAGANGWQIFVFDRYSGFSGYTSSATSHYIEWHKVSFRPATDQEIAAKQATADIAGLSATVTQQASTLATLNTQYANLSSTVTAQGASVSQQATAIASLQNDRNTLFAQYVLSVGVDGRVGGMKLANNGSTVGLTFRSDIVRFEDPDPGTGAMEWYDQAIRMTDGAGKLRMFMGYRA